MFTPNLKAIPCRIYRGALTSERYFEIALSDDERYESLAPRLHMWNCRGKKLSKYEPSSHAPIDGFVAATVVDRADAGHVVIHLPDRELVTLEEQRLVERPEEVGIDTAFNFALGLSA